MLHKRASGGLCKLHNSDCVVLICDLNKMNEKNQEFLCKIYQEEAGFVTKRLSGKVNLYL